MHIRTISVVFQKAASLDVTSLYRICSHQSLGYNTPYNTETTLQVTTNINFDPKLSDNLLQ